MPEPTSPSPLRNWSDEQLIRLEHEWRRVQRSFAYHPHVRIVSMRGDPPGEYEIEFKVRSLRVNDAQQLEYCDAVPMQVWLPNNFPYAPPAARPLTALFHPNVSWEGVHLSAAWKPTDTLVDFLPKVGELLAFRAYDPDSVVNPVAMQWLDANAAVLPLDAAADFSPSAGEEPLARICRYGPATTDHLHKQLTSLRDSLLAVENPPPASEVRDLARRTRLALNLFLEDDVPDALREDASALDEWAAGLPASIPVWDYLRRQRGAVRAARDATESLLDLYGPLAAQIAALEALFRDDAPVDADAAIEQLPDHKRLEPSRLRLPALLRQAEERAKALDERLTGLSAVPPALAVREDSPLGKQLASDLELDAAETRSAQEAAADARAGLEPLIERARQEVAALRQVGAWREYLDLLSTSRELEQKLALWGSAGIEAYYVENQSGRFGPFQFEQPLDLGTAQVAVRSHATGALEIVNVRTTEVVGRGSAGEATVQLRNESGVFPTSFKLTERCEDLIVQLEFIIRQTEDTLAQMTGAATGSRCWCGLFLSVLNRPDAQRGIRGEHRKSTHRWEFLVSDLAALAQWKQRVATAFLVQRMTEAVPRFQNELADTRKRLKACQDRLAAVIARCGREVESGQLLIPPKLAKPYADEMRNQDQIQQEINRVEKQLKQLAAQVAQRFQSPAWFGSAALPELRALPPLPEPLTALKEVISDELLDEQAGQLERMVNAPFRGTAWKESLPTRAPRQPAPKAVTAPPPRAPAQQEFVVQEDPQGEEP